MKIKFKWLNILSSLNFEGLGFVIIMLVSSANRIGFNGSAIIFRRSFTSIKKNKGSSIEPCGTPCFILPHSEKVAVWELLFISTL
jgi:hypothetical protein